MQNVVIRDMSAICMAQIKSAIKHKQVSMKEGIRPFGDAAINAVLKEYTKLNNKNTFRPVQANTPSNIQKRNALRIITVIKNT